MGLKHFSEWGRLLKQHTLHPVLPSRGPVRRRPKLSINAPLVPDSPEPNEYGIVNDDHFDPRHRQPHQIRAVEQTFPTDPAIWLAANYMCQTEVSLRVAHYLLTRKLTTSDVAVSLTGYELTRRENPRFPMVRFLTDRGFIFARPQEEWRGTYILKGLVHTLTVCSEPDDPDLVTTLASGRRLVAFVSRGLLVSTRSPAEHKLLRGAIGRAMTCESAERRDLLAAVVPRSKRFRELAVRWRAAEGASRAGLLILTVDRSGTVDGLPRIGDD